MPYKNSIKHYLEDYHYHLYARGINKMMIFKSSSDYKYFEYLLEKYLTYGFVEKSKIGHYEVLKVSNSVSEHIDLNCYALMPNHFHLLCKNKSISGITLLMRRINTAYSSYFNKKYGRRGPLIEGCYKAVLMKTEAQFIHLSRYIHLNPVTGYLTEKPEDYSFSSYGIYLGREKSDFIEPSLIMENFSTPDKYRSFVEDRKDYQRVLQELRHFVLE